MARHPLRAVVLKGSRLLASCALLLVTGCAATGVVRPAPRPAFDFGKDTFAYVNELDWEYRLEPATGRLSVKQNDPKPEFTHRCFAVVRMARQFFQYARFDPKRPKTDAPTYREIIRTILVRSPDRKLREERIVVPGYASLRSFSVDWEPLLKDATGGAWRSYVQFSNWRMIFPFSRRHQERTAQQLLEQVKRNRLPIVHMIRFAPFPITEIDHAVLVVTVAQVGQEIRFGVYDPNYSGKPGLLTFDRAARTFVFPTTKYFADGPIDAYEIERGGID